MAVAVSHPNSRMKAEKAASELSAVSTGWSASPNSCAMTASVSFPAMLPSVDQKKVMDQPVSTLWWKSVL
ncbi:MAG TPA: hypothetical protein VMS18_24910 [Candidatus Binatia bacterium]|nr:hypothetical protein [Candidatus Binatia bacterium]